jgi:hypothetical protein
MSHPSSNTVGLFGTRGSSTWRTAFKARFSEHGIACFDPQVDGWTPDMADSEAWHMANDKVLLMAITGETFGFGSLAETGFSVLSALALNEQQCVLLFIDTEVSDELARGSPEQAEASRRARSLVLSRLAVMPHPRVYVAQSLDDLLEKALQLCTEHAWMDKPVDPGIDPSNRDSLKDPLAAYEYEQTMQDNPQGLGQPEQDGACAYDATVLYGGGLSWWGFFIPLSVACALVLAGFAATHYGGDTFIRHAVWLALLGLLAIPSLVMKKQSISAYVTARHVVFKDQLFSLHMTTLNINRVESVDIHQTFMQRVLRYGTVVVRGLGSEDMELRGLARPAKFKEAVLTIRANTPL